MTSSRRDFLKHSVTGVLSASALGGLGAFGVPFAWTQDKTAVVRKRPTLVVIYLRGGADPLNTIVPFHDRDYYAVRPTIAIPHPGTRQLPEGERACLPLDKRFGLHPAMEPLRGLYEQKMLAPIVNVGSTHDTRSHFDAQDFMEWAAPGVKSIQEGWLSRYLQATARPDDHFLRAFCPQPLLPRSLRGEYSALAAPGPSSGMALDVFDDLYEPCDEKAEQDRPQEPSGEKPTGEKPTRGRRKKEPETPPRTEEELTPRLRTAGMNTVEKLRHLNRILVPARKTKRGYPRGTLGQQLSDIAAILKARQPLEVAAVDYNGWDHHSYQGGSNGQQARMLGYLSQCIAAFVRDLGPQMEDVLVLTMTEFGRTVRENGSQGTDHGHGGFMLAVGGRVKGGQVYGKWTGLQPGRLHQKRDLPVHVDFRDVFGETLGGLYGFDVKETGFFPEYKRPLNRPLGLFAKT